MKAKMMKSTTTTSGDQDEDGDVGKKKHLLHINKNTIFIN